MGAGELDRSIAKLSPFRPSHAPGIAAVAALALAGAQAPARPPAPQPGYHCSYDRQGDYGSLSADFEVPRDGHAPVPAYLSWAAGGATYRDPHISAAFYRRADGHYRVDNGFAAISWWVAIPRGRTLNLSLQLRTRPEPQLYSRALLASEFERTGGPLHVSVDWSDIAAFARGARALYLVAVDRHRRVVATAQIDQSVFARAEPHIVAALSELEAIIANPAATCEFLDDLRSNDVIVT